MKKVLFLVLALGVCLVGCSNNQTAQNTEEDLPILQEDDKQTESAEETATKYFPEENLNKYEVVQVIQLNENPTTGYEWQYTIDDDTVAVVEGDEYGANQTDEEVVGVGGIHAYRISGLREGETTMTFKHMRSWEGEESATEIVVFKVSVNSDMKIAVIEEIHK